MSPPSASAIADAKRSIRLRIKARREAMDVDPTAQHRLDTLAVQLLSALQPSTVFCYLATAGEVGTAGLIDGLHARGINILVPAIIDRTTMIAARFMGWSTLVPGRLGIPAPAHVTPWEGPVDCVVVPGLAYSLAGARLGFGAGYYDRWLAAHPTATRIGLCFEYQLEAAVPVEAHDEAMHYLVTERRIAACSLTRNR